MDLDTPSESHSMSTSGIFTQVPHARPTYTPISTGEGTDAERPDEASQEVTVEQSEETPGATVEQTAAPEPPVEEMIPDEPVIIGDPSRDIEALIYIEFPELMTAQEYISPVMTKLVEKLVPTNTVEEEDKEMIEFASSCFNETYDQLLNRMEPIEDGVERALGSANDAFPQLLPRVFNKY